MTTPALLSLLPLFVPAQAGTGLSSLESTTIRSDDWSREADVGRLRVPENRSRSDSRTIELAFVRLRSTADEPGPPIFLLPGGPGNAATPTAEGRHWELFLELGDVVLLDPRGVGESEPELVWESDAIRPELLFGDRETAVRHMAEVCRAAAEDYGSQGIDLAGYTTTEMADDVDALRAALGYEQVKLLGHSFGTHLGLEILRRHPDRVARFVSVGTAGTQHMMKLPSQLDRSLKRLSERVAADPAVGGEMPNFEAAVREAVAMLDEEPLPVPVTDPRTGAEVEVSLGAFGFQLILVADLGDTNDLPVYPRLVHSVLERDPSIVRWFLEKRMQQMSAVPVLTFVCRAASGATAVRWERIRREGEASPFGISRCLFSPEVDAPLGVRDLGDAFRAPVASDVPTLLVSGTFDAHTPPEQAEEVRALLSHSGHVVVSYGGHEDLLPDPAVLDLVVGFLAGDEPRDVRIDREPLRFAPLEGGASRIRHPALTSR